MIAIVSQEVTAQGFSATLTDGKTTMDVFRFSSGMVNVVVRNAAHSAYRGSGKVFASWEAAKGGYKSASSRSLIEAAETMERG